MSAKTSEFADTLEFTVLAFIEVILISNNKEIKRLQQAENTKFNMFI